MVLIEVFRDGKRVRFCGARCHNAPRSEREKSRCCCGGALRGIVELGIKPEQISSNYLNEIRERMELGPGEYVQLRIGA